METMEQRRKKLLQWINEKGEVRFAEIKEEFPHVSEMTLRTDLKILDEEKKILRIHGGAKSVQVLIGTDDFLQRKLVRHIEEKENMAKKAVALLEEDTTIYLDSGSSITAMAKQIPDVSYLIYTTGLSCATALADLRKPTIMLPGGKFNRYSHSVCGYSAIKELEQVNFRQVYLGVTGFHPEVGFSCGVKEEAILKQQAMQQADQVIVLMDSSKIGVKCSFQICQLPDIDMLIVDDHFPKEIRDLCQREGVAVI